MFCVVIKYGDVMTWRRFPLLVLCVGNPSVIDGFPCIGPLMRSFVVAFVIDLNKQLNKKKSCRWFETPWRPCDVTAISWGSSGDWNFRQIKINECMCIYTWPPLFLTLIYKFCNQSSWFPVIFNVLHAHYWIVSTFNTFKYMSSFPNENQGNLKRNVLA